MLIKLILLTCCCYVTYGTQSSENPDSVFAEAIQGVYEKSIVEEYKRQKLNVISYWLKKTTLFPQNSTMVGTQNIYGSDGNLVEIRTIQLHIPEIGDIEEDDYDYYKNLELYNTTFNHISRLGFSAEIIKEEYDKNGDLDAKIYISKDIKYEFYDKAFYLNQRVEVDTSKQVNDKIKELQAKYGTVGVLKFGANSKFLSEESNMVPDYAVSVFKEEGEPDPEIIYEAKKGLATIFPKYKNNREEIPSKLIEYMSSKYPKVDFYIFLKKPSASYTYHEYKIHLHYNLDDWYNQDFSCWIYGHTKFEDNTTESTE